MSSSKEYEAVSRSSVDEPLLSEEEEKDYPRPKSKFRRNFFKYILPAIINILSFGTYIMVVTFSFNKWIEGKDCRKPLVYSPAQDAIVYERVDYVGALYAENTYKGPPTPERDQAWAELIWNSNLRLTKDEITKLNVTALELNDGSGYMVGMNVHHHLHCVKYVYQVMHPEYYYDTLKVDPDLMEHVYHCLDDIRQALMCHPDITMYPLTWTTGYRKPWPIFDVTHQCASWDVLDGWATERAFDIFTPKLLVHPDLGLSYPVVNGQTQTSALGNDTILVFLDDDGNEYTKPLQDILRVDQLGQDQHDHEAHLVHPSHEREHGS